MKNVFRVAFRRIRLMTVGQFVILTLVMAALA